MILGRRKRQKKETNPVKVARVLFNKYFEFAANKAAFIFGETVKTVPQDSTFLRLGQFLTPYKIGDETIKFKPLARPSQTAGEHTLLERGYFGIYLDGVRITTANIETQQYVHFAAEDTTSVTIYEDIGFVFDQNKNYTLLTPRWLILSYYSVTYTSLRIEHSCFESTTRFIHDANPNVPVLSSVVYDSTLLDHVTEFILVPRERLRKESGYSLFVRHKFDRTKHSIKYPLEYRINSFHPLVLFGVMNIIMNRTAIMLSCRGKSFPNFKLLE